MTEEPWRSLIIMSPEILALSFLGVGFWWNRKKSREEGSK